MDASYRHRIETLEREVAELRSLLGVDRPAPRILPRAKVRALIKQFFAEHDGEVIYPSDVAEALNLSHETVERAIVELEADGKIAKA